MYRNNAQYPLASSSSAPPPRLNKSPGISLQIIDTYRAAKDPENAARKPMPLSSKLRTQANGKNTPQLNIALATIYEKAKRYAEETAALDAAEKLSPSKEEQETIHFMRGAMSGAAEEDRSGRCPVPQGAGDQPRKFRRAQLSGLHAGGSWHARGRSHADDQEGAGFGSRTIALIWTVWDGRTYQQGKFEEAESLLVRALDRLARIRQFTTIWPTCI